MKEISRTQIEKSVKTAEKEARAWCKRDWRHTYQIMIDTEDADIWVDTFVDCNSWKQYKSDSIMSLDAMSAGGRVGDAVHQLEQARWKIL